MSALRPLVGLELKTNFSLAALSWQIRHGKNRLRTLGIAVLIAVALVPMVAAFILGIKSIYGALHAIGQESALILLGVITGQALVFVFGFFYVISAFYFSNDLERLIALPLRPNEVVISKFLVVIINEYFSIMPFVLPVFLGYGILARAPLEFWILLVPVYLLLPVVPLALSALLAIGLMRVVNLTRKKDALIIIGSLVLIGLNFFFQVRAHGEGDTAAIARLLTERDGLVQLIGRRFPPSVWASRSLSLGFSPEGMGQLGLLAGLSAAVLFGMVALSEKLFYEGAIGLSEIAAKRRKLSRLEMERSIAAGRGPVRAILDREIKIMNRTPVYLLNGVLVGVLVPALLIASAGTSDDNPLGALVKASESGHTTVLILVVAAFALVCGCMSGTASSSFSREGKYFWISKIIPVPWRRQVAAKFIHSYLVSLVGIAAALIGSVFVAPVPAPALAAAALLALAGAVPLNAAGLWIDLARPKLKWTNPQQAIKQNLNVVFAMIADAAYLVVCGFLAYFLLRAGVPGSFVYFALLTIAVVTAWGVWRGLAGFAGRKYPEMEA
jgi:ABC-2 type transport system permease protein